MALMPRANSSPRATHAITPLVSATAAYGTYRSSEDLPVVLRRDLAPNPWEMNAVKGSFGETLAQKMLRLRSDPGTRWLQPHRGSGGQGIDLLRVEGSGGKLTVVVTEVKFGTSRPGKTHDGTQLSGDWVKNRLRKTADAMRERAGALSGKAKLAQLRDAELVLRAANGSARVETELLRVDISGDNFVVSVEHGDNNVEFLFRDAFRALPSWAQHTIRSSFENTFRANGFGQAEARRLSREACANPRFFRHMAKQRTYSWRAGVDAQTAWSGVTAMIVAAAVQAAFDLFQQGRVDWGGVIATSVVAGAAAAVGNFVGVQTVSLMTGTEMGRLLTNRMLTSAFIRGVGIARIGSLAGGVAAGLVFAYGSALLGLTDWRTAHRTSASIVIGAAAGFGASSATFGVAVIVGTASTGTPLAALSGAALAKATLAYLGGGSIAAGGLGVAGGLVVLTGVGAV